MRTTNGAVPHPKDTSATRVDALTIRDDGDRAGALLDELDDLIRELDDVLRDQATARLVIGDAEASRR